MKLTSASVLLALTFLSTTTFAQTITMDLFCNAGLRPDGYIDFNGLPPGPNFPSSGGGGPANSGPFSAALPVKGVPGLTVQVTIPGLQSLARGPIYSVGSGTLVFNGFPATDGQLVILQFSNPVAGVGLVANSVGRQSDFTLETDASGPYPPNFQNSADTLTIAPEFYSIPLQQVDLRGGFTTAYVLFGGSLDGFGLPSLSNLRVQSTAASYASMVPENGLQQWLTSESVQTPFLGGAASWTDQSGNGHDATQTAVANQPSPVPGDGNACQPAFSFDGNQYFNFNLPIAGWQRMTIFLVGKSAGNPPPGSYASASAAIFWNEDAYWGNTFVSPYQTSETFRFGTTQAGNQPIYNRPVTVGQDFTITRAVHDGSTDSLYVNGLLALRQGDKLPVLSGTTGTAFIGRGMNNTYFQGEISEILVYNRVLSTDEATSVEFYLRNKFGTR